MSAYGPTTYADEALPKPLPKDQSARVIEAIVNRLLPRYDGNNSAVARVLHVDPSTVHAYKHGTRGTSLDVAKRVAQELDQDVWELLGEIQPQAVVMNRWDRLPGYDKALAEARVIPGNDKLPEWVWRMVGRECAFPPPPLTAEKLSQTAWHKYRLYDCQEPEELETKG